ncbi:sodium:calcium antiporter [Egicoccus halophilus]|uniref:Sodium:calcium antiporter n=1 Tax=Egicoccus halophilus TaxID=1670830 RepID=A0A8J3ETY9_9ACTN|nr:sodium:calcium antiporter [Egicoccus halophilus]GGI04863.1 sodium:calcium antiporter [Egicoccus halophilus]
MDTLVPLALLVVGLVVLVYAADQFVAGAEAVALRLRWSATVIGAVVVGFGTSLPELVTSVTGALQGDADLAIGNAAGSNVANLLLILGIAAVVSPVVGRRDQAPVRDGVIAGAGSVLLLGLAIDGSIGLVDGLVLVGVLLAAVVWQVVRAGGEDPAGEVPLPPATRLVGVRVVLGLLGVLVGAQLLVAGAIDLAEAAGVPQILIASVLVAVGTSLPELATAVASARRGQVEILLGNLLGSNAFNALFVVGTSALVATATGDGLAVDTPALVVVVAAAAVTGLAALLLARRPRVPRPVGVLLVALHLASVPALLAIS